MAELSLARVFRRTRLDNSGCWLWIGKKHNEGYGLITSGKPSQENVRWHRVHRVVFEQIHGPVPQGLVLDHLCRIRNCVNPAHLEAVTQLENTMRGRTVTAANAAKTRCPQGHPYDLSRIAPETGRPKRGCSICQKEQARHRIRKRPPVRSSALTVA